MQTTLKDMFQAGLQSVVKCSGCALLWYPSKQIKREPNYRPTVESPQFEDVVG